MIADILSTLAVLAILAALLLSFSAGRRRSLGKSWRRLVLSALALASLGYLMAALSGFAWGYKEVWEYYIETRQEPADPQEPDYPPPDNNIQET